MTSLWLSLLSKIRTITQSDDSNGKRTEFM